MFVCKRSKAASDPCSASLSLTNGTIVKVNGKKVECIYEPLVTFHKHKSCAITDDELEALKSMERMKERAKTENLSIPLIHEEEILALKTNGKTLAEITKIIPSYDSVKTKLYRSKWTKYPQLPKTLDDVVFTIGTKTDRFMKTFEETNERFLLVDCVEDDQRIIIFASDLQLRLLCSSKQIGVDGTFKSCPSLFAQLYIIMGWCKGECMPVAFALLGGKKEATYRRMLLELTNACRNLSLEFRPPRIILDFEQGAIAFKHFFIESYLIGCFFHFGQCLFRKLVECGYKVAYGADEELQKWFKSCIALAFVPPRKIQILFSEKILDEAPFEKYHKLEDFTDYMLETWIEDDALFPSELWNHYANTEERVNNNNEGYNHRFATRTGKVPHPNMWKLCEVFQKEEFLLVQVRCERLKDGSLASLGEKKCDLKRNIQILQAKNKYLRSSKTYDDLLILFESCTCTMFFI